MENSLSAKPFGNSFSNKMNIKQENSILTDKMKQKPKIVNKNCLSNIVELTQEYQQGKTMISQKISNVQTYSDKQKKSVQSQEQPVQHNNLLMKLVMALYTKTVNCFQFTYSKIWNQFASTNVNIEQSQISQILQKLRKKKSKKLNLLPELGQQQSTKRTLVLQLDETLIYMTSKKLPRYDFCFQSEKNGKMKKYYVVKRFGLDSFLFQMKQFYQIVIFSNLIGQDVESLLGFIDPKKNISYFLSREHCIVINKTYYIKPLKDIGRDCKNVIAIDSHPISASLNPENLYRIQPFRGSLKDRKLIKLTQFLKNLNQLKYLKSITPIQLLKRQFQSKQIHISLNQKNKNKQNLTYKIYKNQKQTQNENDNQNQNQQQQIQHKRNKSEIQLIVQTPSYKQASKFQLNS